MALLKFRNEAPPGGWRYFQAETRLMIKGDGPDNLLSNVIEHRKYKGLTPTDRETVWLEIERQLCSRLSERNCVREGPNDDWVPVKEQKSVVDFGAIVGFSRAALEWIGSGREVVPAAEAQRRAAICLACPLNAPSEGCLPCSVLYGMIEKSVPKHRRIEGLEICGVCHCSNQAKVNLPADVVRESNRERGLAFPSHCWQQPLSS